MSARKSRLTQESAGTNWCADVSKLITSPAVLHRLKRNHSRRHLIRHHHQRYHPSIHSLHYRSHLFPTQHHSRQLQHPSLRQKERVTLFSVPTALNCIAQLRPPNETISPSQCRQWTDDPGPKAAWRWNLKLLGAWTNWFATLVKKPTFTNQHSSTLHRKQRQTHVAPGMHTTINLFLPGFIILFTLNLISGQHFCNTAYCDPLSRPATKFMRRFESFFPVRISVQPQPLYCPSSPVPSQLLAVIVDFFCVLIIIMCLSKRCFESGLDHKQNIFANACSSRIPH